VHINGAGTTTISVSQTGNDLYAAATSVSQTLTVSKKEQSITFNNLGDKQVGDEDFTVVAGASSGLPVTFSSSDEGVARIVDGKVHIVGGGSTIITAAQSGNEVYRAAPAVTQQLNVFVPPLVKARGNIEVAVDENGTALITASMVDSGSVSYNGALTLTVDKTSFTCSDIGTPLTVTLSAGDEKGYSSAATATVTVVDQLKPVLTAPSAQHLCYKGEAFSYSLPAVRATDNCGIASISYAVSGATIRTGTGSDASGVFNTGTSTITWTVRDVHGNVSTATTTITVEVLVMASIPDVYALNASVDAKNTLYLGYGPSFLTLSAQAGGGTTPYSYQWSSGQATASIPVSAAGSYSVKVTDAMGCQSNPSALPIEEVSATATTNNGTIDIKVVDVRCGNDNTKVQVCHNGKAICVASAAVQDHLKHGDGMGSCSVASITSVNSITEEVSTYQVQVYPNPVADNLNIRVSKLEAGATVQVYNVQGAVVLSQPLTNTAQSLSVHKLTPGIYYIKLNNGGKVSTQKIIKQ
jgi:hypothetical protein